MAWRTQTCQRIADVILGALAPALPERVIAGDQRRQLRRGCSAASTRRPGQYYVYLETIGGGSGARATKDGLDGVQVHITNTSNLPVECLEMEYPLFVEEYALVPGPAAPAATAAAWASAARSRGRPRGAFLGTLDRARIAPWGLFGAGRAAGRPRLKRAGPTGGSCRPRSGLRLEAGESVTIVTPGAGGYGPPP